KFASLLRRGTQYELALARLSYRRVAALDDLKWVFHRLHMIEPQRSSFVEIFEKSWVDEVAHGKAVTPELLGLTASPTPATKSVPLLRSHQRLFPGSTSVSASSCDAARLILSRTLSRDLPASTVFTNTSRMGRPLKKWKAETCLACLPNIFFRSWRRFLTSAA